MYALDNPTYIAKYRYNGLGFRIMSWEDEDASGTLDDSERFYFMYDERWRPVGTFRDQDDSPKEAFLHHAAGVAGYGGSSYIDSVILRDRDNSTEGTPNPMTSESDGVLEERRFFCQNWRADVVAVTKADGTPIEYVRYSSYGEPTVYPVADVNMDGKVDSSDLADWVDLETSSPCDTVVGQDLDWDGGYDYGSADADLFYESYYENLGLSGKGRLSTQGVDNRIGYAGYQWDQVLRGDHVRYRVYMPENHFEICGIGFLDNRIHSEPSDNAHINDECIIAETESVFF